MIHHGDLFDVLPTLAEASIDACVTDPPYGLEFMGKEWDKLDGDGFRRSVNPADVGRENVFGRTSRTSPEYSTGAGRTSKPGIGERQTEWPSNRGWNQTRCTKCGHLSHGGSPCRCEQPEFAIADNRWYRIQDWHEAWAREVYRVLKPGAHLVAFGGPRTFHRLTCGIEDAGFEIRDCLSWLYGQGFPKSLNLPHGLGTALKPSWEPCVVARKPLIGTVAANIEKFNTGALNIDASRIGDSERTYDLTMVAGGFETTGGGRNVKSGEKTVTGRWPANVLLDESAAQQLDEMTGELTSGAGDKGNKAVGTQGYGSNWRVWNSAEYASNSGGASRFYYVAKPSREERDYGTNGLTAGNRHPTVKPVELMRWLVKLVTPPGGTVLDPFTGSGTTGMACRYELREFVGIEREADYIRIAEARISAVAPLFSQECDGPAA